MYIFMSIPAGVNAFVISEVKRIHCRDDDEYDTLNYRSLSAKEPLIIGFFSQNVL